MQSTTQSPDNAIHVRRHESSIATHPGSRDKLTDALLPPQTHSDQAEPSDASSDDALIDNHLAGTGSAHSWLKQAWSCLARVRKNVAKSHHFATVSDPDTCTSGDIFSYGDKKFKQDSTDLIDLHKLSPSTIETLLSIYFNRSMATYRFLHRPTVNAWLHGIVGSDRDSSIPPTRIAILKLILSLGFAYLSDAERALVSSADVSILKDETLYFTALKHLGEEIGAPSVESIQARLVQVHYLLTSSRPNKAWYVFGAVIQLTLALDLHQKGVLRHNSPGLSRELRRRVFWAVYKTDKSISIAFGRPSLLRDEFITQDMPETIDDEKIFLDRIEPRSGEDCLMEADLLQIKLAQIVSRSMSEYYETDDDTLIRLVMNNNIKLADWKTQLPPFLSGIVRPSSLIPVMGRQSTLLKIVHLHAIMFINRPLLLKSFSNTKSAAQDHQVQFSIDASIDAAYEIARQAVQFDAEGQAFHAFWFTQVMVFNAVSILYLNLLRLKQSKNVLNDHETETMVLAERAQKSLTIASRANVPGLRYEAILEQLRREIKSQWNGANTDANTDNLNNDGSAEKAYEAEPNIDQTQDWDWADLFPDMQSQDVSTFWPQFDGLPQGTS